MAQAQSLPAPAAPWGERLFAAAPLPPFLLGMAVTLAVLLLLAASEWLLGDLPAYLRGEAEQWKRDEYFFHLIFGLLLGYVPAAWVYAVRGSQQTLQALKPALRCSEAEYAALQGELGRFDPRRLRWSGVLGIGVAFLIPLAIDLTWETYAYRGFNLSGVLHRLLLPLVGWTIGRFVYAMLADSSRLARIGREQVRVELLDLGPLRPFARHGLRNALFIVGIVSIIFLLGTESGSRPGLPVLMGALFLLAGVCATFGLLLPVRGVHAAIHTAKREELDWCGAEIRRQRSALAGEGAAEAGRLADLVSYRRLVETVREWPFDTPTLARFALYLAIPLGSWLGGALVERLVDRLF